MPARKPAPNTTRKTPARKPTTRKPTSGKRSQTRKPANRDGRVKAHTRRTKHGTVHVGAHDRDTRHAQWITAANTWAGAAATGILALGLLLQLSFTLIAAVAIVLAVTLKVLVHLLTGEDLGRPQRRRRAAGRHTRRPANRRRSR